MDVSVDTARQQQLATRVQLADRLHLAAQLDDTTVENTNIDDGGPGVGGELATAYDELAQAENEVLFSLLALRTKASKTLP